MIALALVQAELHSIVAARSRDHPLGRASCSGARWWRCGGVEEVIERGEVLFDALSRVADYKGLATRSRPDCRENRRVFDGVIQPAAIPACFERQALGNLVIHAENTVVLAVRLQARGNSRGREAASRAGSGESTVIDVLDEGQSRWRAASRPIRFSPRPA